MTPEETKNILAANREMVISFYHENVKEDRFYNLKWFMTRVLAEATICWERRKNISVRDVERAIKAVMRNNPKIKKGYVSNWQKAVNYYGYDMAKKIADAR